MRYYEAAILQGGGEEGTGGIMRQPSCRGEGRRVREVL